MPWFARNGHEKRNKKTVFQIKYEEKKMSYRINFEHDVKEVEEKINSRNTMLFPNRKGFVLAALMSFQPEANIQPEANKVLLAETNDLLRELNLSIKKMLQKSKINDSEFESENMMDSQKNQMEIPAVQTEKKEKERVVDSEKNWEMPDMSKYTF